MIVRVFFCSLTWEIEMSWKMLQEVWEYGPQDHAEFSVLLAIAYHANDDGENAWPGMRRLAKMTRYTVRGVRNVIIRLEEKQLLKVERGVRL
jgi:DNA-binding MarR family transcriptional regulator